MPLYEYQCGRCGRFELIRKFSDPPVEVCPTCGAEVQKLLSSPAIQFKGAGWYVTDYAKKSGGGEGGKSEGSKSTEAASTSSSSTSSGSSGSGSGKSGSES
jgi:putative FmdB family regulatory protein